MTVLPRKFNPGLNQDDQSLISQFVVRKPLLKVLLETVEDNTTRSACQHRLYYGPRGRGKTMLMARVAAEIRVNDKYAKHWIAIRLFEESYCEIATIAEFWLEVMSELTLSLPVADKDNAELSLAHLKENWNHPNLEQMAQGAVLEQLEKQGKKAIIMVENLHQLLDETDDDFDWHIRRVMQNEKNIMFLATATTRFESLDNAKDAFFEIFAISELKRLKRSDIAILWNAITRQDKTEIDVAPLDILTGGSPRLLNIVAQFSKDSSIRELMENLTGLVDEYTEYFKSQVEALAPKERRVFLALADLWKPSSAKEISERARMDIRTASALLGRLEHKGALRVNADKPRKKMYSIAERLFCIYYKLRRKHSPDSVIEALVQFMVDFYTSDEINEIRQLHLKKELLSIEEEVLLKRFENIDSDTKYTEYSPDVNDLSYDLKDIDNLWDQAMDCFEQGDTEKELTLYQTLIDRYQNREEEGIVEPVTKAMFNQAVAYSQQGDIEQALVPYQTLIDHYQNREEEGIVEPVANAMINQAGLFAIQQQWGKAEQHYQQALSRNVVFPDSDIYRSTASLGLLISQQADIFSEKQCVALAKVIKEANENSIEEERITLALGIAAILPNKIALAIIENAEYKDELQPIIIALKQDMGESVRASDEILEVAADVTIRIKELRGKYF